MLICLNNKHDPENDRGLMALTKCLDESGIANLCLAVR